jgi:phospholipid/cholesterol/gamma-HCH transport system substrate-binding protein
MAAPTNHWKLGLFVVVGIVLSLVTITFLGAESLKKQVVSYQTYFDESVQGLEVGSPVKFRGVTVGTVSVIGIAPDRRHVAVTSELAIADLSDLGLAVGKGEKSKIRVPPDLRMQVVSQGITGVKFLLIDFFDIKDNPVPELPFPVPENYIPAAVSTMKNLEDAVVRAVNRIPEIAEGIVVVMGKVNRLLDEVQGGQLLENGAATLARANQVLATLQHELDQAHIGQLSSRADEMLTLLNATLTRSNTLLARLDGDKGLMASAQRASNAVGDVAVNARSLGPELEETLRDVQEFTAAIQRVADALERDPDMLLKGRARAK